MSPTASGGVVVGVDESMSGLAALRYAADEARRRGVILRAMRVVVTPTYPHGYEPEPERDQLREEAAASVVRAFGSAMGGVPRDLIVHSLIAEGPVADALVEAGGVLLVIGASSWRLFGPARVQRQVLRLSRCPVVVVPAPDLAHNRRERALVRAMRREMRQLDRFGMVTMRQPADAPASDQDHRLESGRDS